MDFNNYYLLKMISAVGQITGRKKLQKLMYLLQFKKLPLDDRYILHYFGPYSVDLASRVDILSKRELLKEESHDNGFGGVEYNYAVSTAGEGHLSEYEESDPGLANNAETFIQLFEKLNEHNVWELELASTMLYWRKWGNDWPEAEAKTAKKKKADTSSKDFADAKTLAEEIWT